MGGQHGAGSASSVSATWACRWRATWSRPATRCTASTCAGRGRGACRGAGGIGCGRASPRPGRCRCRHHHAARRPACRARSTRIEAGILANAAAGHAPDRLLDDRRRDGARRRTPRPRRAASPCSMRRCPAASPGPRAATLTFMVGGEAEALRPGAEPLLAAMGKTIIHAGAAGNGQAAKICNNMMLGIQMISVGEAFVAGASGSACRRRSCSRSAGTRRASAGP